MPGDKEIGKKFREFTVENVVKRSILIVLVIIGVIIFAVGLLLRALNYIDLGNLMQMGNLGVLSPDELSFRQYELFIDIARNSLIAQIGAIITAILLIIAAVSPISGKGTPYFSEYVRLGLIALAALAIYVAITLTPEMYIP